jgi:hypothetical protein
MASISYFYNTALSMKFPSRPCTFFLLEREVFILFDFYWREVISLLIASKWSLKLYNTFYNYYIIPSATTNYSPRLSSYSLTLT